MTNTKTARRERLDIVRKRLQSIRSERFDGSLTKLATEMRVSQSTVSDFLNGHRGAGNALIEGIARIDQELAAFAHNIYAKPTALPQQPGTSDQVRELTEMLSAEGNDFDSAMRAATAAVNLLPPGSHDRLEATARVLATWARGLQAPPPPGSRRQR